eukprot:2759481-Pleurochrysis_carterae.AAC.2
MQHAGCGWRASEARATAPLRSHLSYTPSNRRGATASASGVAGTLGCPAETPASCALTLFVPWRCRASFEARKEECSVCGGGRGCRACRECQLDHSWDE